MKHINLGKKIETPSPSKHATKDSAAEKVSYPTMYVHGVKELHDLPKDKFHFHGTGKVISSTKRVDRDGKEHHSHEIEVHSIAPHDQGSSGGLDGALDEIAAKKGSKK